ncbi:MAG: lysophospholipid acyltransferase family protein [Cyclobacteriaceae bacterium]|nr:lysophospholipid acyltransferase family protein [Cyclobacteriaceae bacterium]
MRIIFGWIFRLMGWKIVGDFPRHLKKYIVAVAPHTSNWDFPIGVMARSILKMEQAKFLGKDSLFKSPFGWFFRWLGGYPVDRSSHNDVVQQVVDIFNAHENFILALAPEGTRKKVDKMRTGFYYIAKGAGVPIVPVGFDFAQKRIVLADPMMPTDNFDKDMDTLLSFYRQMKGKNPELGL